MVNSRRYLRTISTQLHCERRTPDEYATIMDDDIERVANNLAGTVREQFLWVARHEFDYRDRPTLHREDTTISPARLRAAKPQRHGEPLNHDTGSRPPETSRYVGDSRKRLSDLLKNQKLDGANPTRDEVVETIANNLVGTPRTHFLWVARNEFGYVDRETLKPDTSPFA